MFDEPLTVIDPHLKWKLRSKLKELHQRVGSTMIYVTHDQTEALTFADKVVLMVDGTVVQIGTPTELFEHPKHTFVGHFIGSPGMNILAAELQNGKVSFEGNEVNFKTIDLDKMAGQNLEIGIRPEFVHFTKNRDEQGIPVNINKITDLGKHQIVETAHNEHIIKLIVKEGVQIPSESPHIVFEADKTKLYSDNWVVN